MATLASEPARPGMGTFERYLTIWVALCIVAGIALGHALPGVFASIAGAEVARVNLVVAALIWLMIVPMLLRIDFGSLGSVRQHGKGVGVTLFINWALKPFSMAALDTFFIGFLFAPLLPIGQGPSYIAALILLAAAPCTAIPNRSRPHAARLVDRHSERKAAGASVRLSTDLASMATTA